MKDFESIEKGKLLKEVLMIVDKLGDLDINEIEDLIEKSMKLKKNKYWKLN